jgi:hypothetical protein
MLHLAASRIMKIDSIFAIIGHDQQILVIPDDENDIFTVNARDAASSITNHENRFYFRNK